MMYIVIVLFLLIKLSYNINWIEDVFCCPINYIIKHISLITIKPTYSHEELLMYYPELDYLTQNWKKIREDYLRIKNKIKPVYKDYLFDDIVNDDKWKRYNIKWYGPIDKKVKSDIPFTSNLIEECSNIQLAMFSVMEPETIVKPHIGLYKGSLRII